jgi:hypothetical protein
VEPAEAWRTVVLNRWKKLCPSRFDILAEQAGIAYPGRIKRYDQTPPQSSPLD